MSQYDEIKAALLLAKRRLYNTVIPDGLGYRVGDDGNKAVKTRLMFKPEQVDRMLRVVMTGHVAGTIIDDRDASLTLGFAYDRDAALRFMDGRGQIMDVDCYIVGHLPEPGWRVINPMEKS